MVRRLNSRQRATLERLFSRPTRADLRWADVQSLLSALGVELSEGRGSRIRLHHNGLRMVLHKPHSRPEMVKATVEDLQDFLPRAGLAP